MPKKAFLVGFSPLTRVVVDVPDGKDQYDEKVKKDIIRAAAENIKYNFSDKINAENCDRVEEDSECPYDEEKDWNLLPIKDKIVQLVNKHSDNGVLLPDEENGEEVICDISWSFLFDVYGSTDGDDFGLKRIEVKGDDVRFFWTGCNSNTELEYDAENLEDDCLEYILNELQSYL